MGNPQVTKTRQLLALTTALMLIAGAANSQVLRAVPADPLGPVIGALILNLNPQQDKCYNRDADGNLVEVACPDVIVAKPDANAQQTPQMVAALVLRRQFVPRATVRALGAQVPISEGTYNCYNEVPANSGNFVRVACPDIIVLDTSD